MLRIDGAGNGASAVSQAFLWALRAGVFVGKNEIALEVSPMTYIPYGGLGPSFQLNASYGYLFAISESPGGVSAYWPIRIGLGAAAGNLGGNAFLQTRFDLVGVLLQIGHILIDLHAPSFRFETSPQGGVMYDLLTWHFGGGIGYAF
jgi:hypothetical protein